MGLTRSRSLEIPERPLVGAVLPTYTSMLPETASKSRAYTNETTYGSSSIIFRNYDLIDILLLLRFSRCRTSLAWTKLLLRCARSLRLVNSDSSPPCV